MQRQGRKSWPLKAISIRDCSLVAVTTAIAVLTAAAAMLQLGESVPVSPWESSLLVEGVRLARGQTIYDSAHATHMYGPLLTVLFAAVYKMGGIDFSLGRTIISLFGAGTAVLVTGIASGPRHAISWVTGIILVLGLALRTNLVCFSMQPDCVAVFFAVFALCLWARPSAFRGARFLAIGLFVVAVLFKQTAVAFALVPVVYTLIWCRSAGLRGVAVAVVPLAAIALAFAFIRFSWPEMFRATVFVPASLKVYPARALQSGLYLICTFPIAVVALLSVWRQRRALNDHVRWILVSVAVLLPVAAWTMGKTGGDYNSLFYAYLALTALVISDWPKIIDPVGLKTPWPIIAGVGVAILLSVSYFVQLPRVTGLLTARHGDEKYQAAIEIAARLSQSGAAVVSPQDTTIAFRASGYIGRSLFLELDAHNVKGNWPKELPFSVMQELDQASYVVEVLSFVPTPMFEPALVQSGFAQVSVPELHNSAYRIWRRSSE